MTHYSNLIAVAEFPQNGLWTGVVQEWHVLVARVDGQYHAINNRCTHMAAPLSGGRLRRNMIICPLHGARFDVTNGHCVGDAHAPVRSFPVRVLDGMITAAIPRVPPAHDEVPVAMK